MDSISRHDTTEKVLGLHLNPENLTEYYLCHRKSGKVGQNIDFFVLNKLARPGVNILILFAPFAQQFPPYAQLLRSFLLA